MTEIIEIIERYPKTSAIFIALFSGAIGWLLRNLAQLYIDSLKHKREVRTFFWKEKLLSAKKASEFYLEYINLLNLIQQQFDNLKSDNENEQEFIQNVENQVQFYTNKIQNFPHFEHHHINIFYDLINTGASEISVKIYELNRNLIETSQKDIDFYQKKSQMNETLERLKKCYADLLGIQKNYLNQIRNDIKEYV